MKPEETQLLCTFTTIDELDFIVEDISKTYTLIYNKIYVLQNTDTDDQLVLTYNVSKNKLATSVPISTISVHRKKQTNTIYTINAINKVIEMNNNGILDKSYRIDWSTLENSVIVTAYGKLKVVNTKLLKIINV